MAALLMLTLLVLAGCASSSGGNTLEEAKKRGYITVGFANEAPYAYATPSGELTGEAVEVARAVFKELGIPEVQGVLTEFGNLIPGLEAKRFDAVTAGMFVRPDRCEKVAFANPEYRVGQALGVETGNPKGLKSYADIAAKSDVKVAAMNGGVEYDYLLQAGVKEGQIVVVPDQPAALAAVRSGRAHAMTMTGPALQALLDAGDTSGVERVMDFEQPVVDGKVSYGYGATAFRKSDTAFVEAFNAELKKLEESGKLLEILSQFGFTEAELPEGQTAAPLCQG